MLVLIWASLFLSVSGNYTDTESSLKNNNIEHTEGSTVPTCNVNRTANQSNPDPNCDNNTTKVHEHIKSLLNQVFLAVKQPQVIIAFLTGILLTATICCLSRACHRKKRKSENLSENMEMVTTETVRMVNDCQGVECDDGTHGQAAEAAGTSAPDGDQELKEVEYSNIFFFGSRSSLNVQEPTETEYAEIKKDTAEERQDDGWEGGEALEDHREDEEEKMIEEELETGMNVLAEEEGEDGAVYSTVTRELEEAGDRTEIHVQM